MRHERTLEQHELRRQMSASRSLVFDPHLGMRRAWPAQSLPLESRQARPCSNSARKVHVDNAGRFPCRQTYTHCKHGAIVRQSGLRATCFRLALLARLAGRVKCHAGRCRNTSGRPCWRTRWAVLMDAGQKIGRWPSKHPGGPADRSAASANAVMPDPTSLLADNAKHPTENDKLNGLFVRGVVMSSTAKIHKRKDGSGLLVIVRHAIALQPGLAVWEGFHDPKNGKVKIEGDIVTAFPTLAEFQQVTAQVIRWEERDKRLVMREAKVVP
jgi:hypothetical protein